MPVDRKELKKLLLKESTVAARWFARHVPTGWKIEAVRVVGRLPQGARAEIECDDSADGGKSAVFKISMKEIKPENYKKKAWTRIAHEYAHLFLLEKSDILAKTGADAKKLDDFEEEVCVLFEAFAEATVARQEFHAACLAVTVESTTVQG